jgi:hypothetical protein
MGQLQGFSTWNSGTWGQRDFWDSGTFGQCHAEEVDFSGATETVGHLGSGALRQWEI